MDVRAIHTPPLTIGMPPQQERRDTTVPADAAPAAEQAPVRGQQHPVLTVEEQQFFEGLFPGIGSGLGGHQVYSGGGTCPRGSSGTIVDRRI
jgi:hypothetical protein